MSTHHTVNHLNADQLHCLRVLTSYKASYNWDLTGDGFQPIMPNAIRARARSGFSTFDDDGLTRMVIAAHKLHCRLEIWPAQAFGCVDLIVHRRRSPEDGDSLWQSHPGLEDLTNRCDAEAIKEATP